jgi:prepilin-type processing-associated H-X9-DG protein
MHGKARVSICLKNQGKLMVATQMYEGDHSSFPNQNDRETLKTAQGGWCASIFPYTGYDINIFECPGQEFYTEQEGVLEFDNERYQGKLSYAANGFSNNTNYTYPFGASSGNPSFWYDPSPSADTDPSTVAFMDFDRPASETHSWQSPGIKLGGAGLYIFAAWMGNHDNESVNTAFCDGSARNVKLEEVLMNEDRAWSNTSSVEVRQIFEDKIYLPIIYTVPGSLFTSEYD